MSRASLLCVLACASFCGAVAPLSGQGVMQQAPAPVPSWCNGLACPAFTVLRAGAGYELRRYGASTWVSTAIEVWRAFGLSSALRRGHLHCKRLLTRTSAGCELRQGQQHGAGGAQCGG